MKHLAIGQAPKCDKNKQNTKHEAHIANPIGNEGFAGRFRILDVFVPETDQQIAAHADQLPAHKHDQEVVAHHQYEHRGDKEI